MLSALSRPLSTCAKSSTPNPWMIGMRQIISKHERLDNAMLKVECAAADLIRFATKFQVTEYGQISGLLGHARKYSDAMRRLARVSRSTP
jgi:hypothetical protein